MRSRRPITPPGASYDPTFRRLPSRRGPAATPAFLAFIALTALSAFHEQNLTRTPRPRIIRRVRRGPFARGTPDGDRDRDRDRDARGRVRQRLRGRPADRLLA